MIIPVLGIDPSLRNWGLARGMLDLETGIFTDLELKLVETKPDNNKQVRKNSIDVAASNDIVEGVYDWVKEAKVIFVEVPVGSQSAASMKSYGICVGILGAFRALGHQLIEVNPSENKLVLTGDKNASKDVMINTAYKIYPEANWLKQKDSLLKKNEHLADAVASIHAGVLTPAFQNLIKLLSVAKA